jgi:hypothetical protein
MLTSVTRCGGGGGGGGGAGGPCVWGPMSDAGHRCPTLEPSFLGFFFALFFHFAG